MPRISTRWITVIVLSALGATLVRAQVDDEDKRKRANFLKTRQEQSDSSDSADESPAPRHKTSKAKKSPSPAPHKSPTPKPKTKKKKTGAEEESKSKKGHKAETPDATETTPRPGKKGSPGKKDATPSRKKGITKQASSPKNERQPEEERLAPAPSPSQTPAARVSAGSPRAAGLPTPGQVPAPVAPPSGNTATDEPAELTIEKTGYEKRSGFWYRFFHGDGSKGAATSGAGFRYLTRAVRAEIDRAPADRRNPRWEFIVVHNSGTRQGNAKVFDYYHRHVRHMQNGLAYHFVIGNGTSTGNGQIEVGDRWRRQINGGHVHSDHLNNIALGICLVGDFNRSQPTPAQLQSCEELIRYLRQRCGKLGNHYMSVKPHREVNPPRWATDCPGDAFPYSWFRRFQE